MNKVFDYMKENNVSPQKIKSVLEEVPLTEGFSNLLEFIHKRKENIFDTIIISNANTLFLEWILQKKKLTGLFDKVYTNPAIITDGQIKVSNYHAHSCNCCPVNMCKKIILLNYIKEKKYEYVYYAGDGLGDFCPTTILKEKDIVFSREKYPLSGHIINYRIQNSYEPKVVFWNNGLDILHEIQKNH